jgi:hypothetical protein
MSNSIVTDPNDEASLLSSLSFLSLTDYFYLVLAGGFHARGDLLSVGILGICGFLNNGEPYLLALFESYAFFDLQLVSPSL